MWVKRILCVATVLSALGIARCTEPIWNWAKEALPHEIVVDKVLASNSEFGLREGCQSAVYQLSERTASEIQKYGLRFFRVGVHPANENPRNPFGRWEETPGDIDLKTNGQGSQHTIFGLYALGGCGDAKPAFRYAELSKALTSSGSYYTLTDNNEGIIIVVPRSRLVAYLYVG